MNLPLSIPGVNRNRNKVWYYKGIAMADHGNVAMADRGGHRCQAPPAHCNGPEALLPRQGQPPNATAWLHIRTQPKTHVLSHGRGGTAPPQGGRSWALQGPQMASSRPAVRTWGTSAPQIYTHTHPPNLYLGKFCADHLGFLGELSWRRTDLVQILCELWKKRRAMSNILGTIL